MKNDSDRDGFGISRRAFGIALGAGNALSATPGHGQSPSSVTGGSKTPVYLKVFFAYRPIEKLRDAGYYSWPGAGFDAEGRQAQYTRRLEEIGRELNLRIDVDKQPVDVSTQEDACVASIRQARPDGLLLVILKKSHYENVVRILNQVDLPAVVLAPLGILLSDQVKKLNRRPGVYLVNSLDEDLGAVRLGLKMIATAHRMRESRIVNIGGSRRVESTVPNIGTAVITIPHQDFYDAFARIGSTGQVQAMAQAYLKNAIKRIEPTPEDVHEAAKIHFVLKQLIERENADAVMMDCLPGLMRPHRHVPPCLGFMSLRDEGIPAGCQSDLDATLSLMIIQHLFDRPGFMNNPAMDTEKNRYFGAHCTSPTRMNGPGAPAEPYILRSHCESGWGCAPQVLFKAGQKTTMAKYLSGQNAKMLIYSGTIVRCLDNPPCGGCRTNVEVEVDNVKDATEVQGIHLSLFYGDYARDMRTFCRMMKIECVA
jgi:hypothetical protein